MTGPPQGERRLDLDWIRIAAFGSLILYHVGMFYVTWDWHVKSSRASDAVEPLMLLVNPWRLTLLFIVTGAATRFMADKMKAGKLFTSRMGRLWPPLLLAVLVIVPPQAYFEVYEALEAMGQSPQGSPWLQNFYAKYITASGNWCDAGGCLITPTYNHMWFVAYLIVYTLLLFPLLPLLRRAPKALGVLIAGPGLYLTPFLFLFVLRITLAPIFGQTHEFYNDWYLHPLFFAAFLFGFAVAKHEPFFAAAQRRRVLSLAIAIAAYASWQMLRAFAGDGDWPEWLTLLARFLRELLAWSAILAAFGYASRYLRNADGPVRRYLTAAIFPYYLIHQTAIVVAAHYLDDLRLPLALEVPLLIAFTLLACVATFELARRVPWLSPWLGVSTSKKQRKSPMYGKRVAGEAG